MNSASKSVDEYIAAFDGDQQAFLCALRELIFEVAPTALETMQYKMPSYDVGGRLFAFAVQKHHISVYVCSAAQIENNTNDLGRCSLGKGCIRYRRPGHADLLGLRRLLLSVYG
ncbi:MAG: iron chaperone [Oceanococcus sp.]